MQTFSRTIFLSALASLSAATCAAPIVYTSEKLFSGQINPSYFEENFDGLPPVAPTIFSGNGFSYNVQADGGIYGSGAFLGTDSPNDSLTINFTSGNVTAVGGNFFASDFSDAFQPTAMTLSLNDGSTISFTPFSLLDSFRGFTSTSAIRSLTLDGPGDSLFANIDNLLVGTAASNTIPEPGTLALVIASLGILSVSRRRADRT